MFEFFSDSARRIIFLSRCEAGRLKFDCIDGQHLLLGFVLEDQGSAELQFLKAMGIEGSEPLNMPGMRNKKSFLDRETAEKLQETFSALGPLPESLPAHADMPLSGEAKMTLSSAVDHARGSLVSPLHILWGMFADEVCPVARHLVANGVTRERIESAIDAL
jgi:hypothetical protein